MWSVNKMGTYVKDANSKRTVSADKRVISKTEKKNMFSDDNIFQILALCNLCELYMQYG